MFTNTATITTTSADSDPSNNSAEAGLIVTAATLVIGLLLGTVAGYYGGALGEVLMRIVEVFQAFPFLLAAITMAAVLQPKLGRGIWTPMVALIASLPSSSSCTATRSTAPRSRSNTADRKSGV